MSSKRHKLENDIIRFRNEGCWSKVDEYTKLLSRKHGVADGAVMLITAEAELELYLQEFPPKQKNVAKSRHDLSRLKSKLQEAMSTECKDSLFAVREEACILLCKLLYAQGNTSACVGMIKTIDLEKVKGRSAIPCYMQKLLGEIYAIKGLCLEHTPNSRIEASGRESVINQYEVSAGFFLGYILEYENALTSARSGSHSGVGEPPVSYEMEIAFQRGPLLHMMNKNIMLGIQNLRKTLQTLKAKAATTVQQTLARDLSTVLLRGLAEVSYEPPSTPEADIASDDDAGAGNSGNYILVSSSDPKSDNFLYPTDPAQESVLLLVMSDAMFNTDPILDMSPEYASTRSMLVQDSRKIYNLLAIALTRFSEYDMFTKRIESSLKYSYDEFQIWYQCGLSLYSARKYDRAVKVLTECCRIQPDNPSPFLLASKICYENLDMAEHAFEFAGKALTAVESKHGNRKACDDQDARVLKSQAYIATGIGYSSKCVGVPKEKVESFRAKALLSFQSANDADPLNYKPLLLIAIEQALDRQIQAALYNTKKALHLQPHDLNCLHLLILLLSAHRQVEEAFTILTTVCKLYPENVSLLMTKCMLQKRVCDNEGALQTCHNLMQMWKDLHQSYINSSMNATAMIDRMTSDGLSTANQSVGNELDTDAGSFAANSVALSRIEHVLSGIESTCAHSKNIATMSGHPSTLQAHIWLLTADVYLALKRHEEATRCIQQASTHSPLDHTVFYMQGRLLQCQGQLAEAETMFCSATMVNPKHYKAMLSWANIVFGQGRVQFAKKLLQDSLKINYMCHESWMAMGKVLDRLGDIDAATDCISAAVNLESTAPVVPFTTITKDL